MKNNNSHIPDAKPRRKTSIRAFEDLKFRHSDNTQNPVETVYQEVMQEKETSKEEPSFKARLTMRNYRETKVKTGLSRAEE